MHDAMPNGRRNAGMSNERLRAAHQDLHELMATPHTKLAEAELAESRDLRQSATSQAAYSGRDVPHVVPVRNTAYALLGTWFESRWCAFLAECLWGGTVDEHHATLQSVMGFG